MQEEGKPVSTWVDTLVTFGVPLVIPWLTEEEEEEE